MKSQYNTDAAIEYAIEGLELYDIPILEVLTPTGKRSKNDRIATNFWCKHCGPGN